MDVDAIRTAGSTEHFGRVVAVDDLTFSVRQGDIFGFLGPTRVRWLGGHIVLTVVPALLMATASALARWLVQMIGPALKWPTWVVDLSPSQPFAPFAATVLAVLGATAMAVGLALYNRRDLLGD